MSPFPNSFVETPTPLEPIMDRRGNAALARLNKRGYMIATGLSPYFAGAIGIMGQQYHIREYCPKDATPARFGTQSSTERWLTKGGGRAVFLLLGKVADEDSYVANQQLGGYAWTGYEPNDALPSHPITSAYRIGASALGKHLADDFIQTVVSGTHALYTPEDGIGLETWKSNHAAELYTKVGFVLQERPSQPAELRPTLDPNAPDGKVLDTRLYMAYPNELFTA